MSILYICEKPSQARDIAKHLQATKKQVGYLEGNGYRVTWCLGHLLALAPPEYYRPDIRPWRIEKLPVVPKQWKMMVSPRTKQQFSVIKNLLKQTKHVVIASDPDRAGEAIVRELLDYCHYQGNIERLWLAALDDVSIKKALSTLKSGDDTIALYEAEKSRAASDYLLGLNLSMAASSLYGVNSVLSLGRVQTPTLQLVVDRDHQIEHFKPQTYFTLRALFAHQTNESDRGSKNNNNNKRSKNNKMCWATWHIPDAMRDEQGYCTDQAKIESIAAKVDGEPGVITAFTETPKKQKAPLCFSLSTLQKKASALFGYGAKQVLNIVQSLYEKHKAVTYPRTDCEHLPEDQFQEANAILNALVVIDHGLKPWVSVCNCRFRSSVWNDKKITAHHAIIPTLNEYVKIGKMSQEEFNLYDCIRRQYLAQFLGEYEYLQRQVEIECAGELFTATEHAPRHMGWKQAFDDSLSNEGQRKNKQNTDEVMLMFKQGLWLDNQETKIENKQTTPPARFTDGTLIEAMKTVGQSVEDVTLRKILKTSQGIGTEATRANILDVLFKRGYIKRQGKYVISTRQGRALLAIAPTLLKDPILTAQWEEQLERIAQGQERFDTFVLSQTELLYRMLDELKINKENKQQAKLQLQSDTQNGKVYLCPNCQSPLRRLKNKKQRIFWGCSAYDKGCRFTVGEKQGKPLLINSQ